MGPYSNSNNGLFIPDGAYSGPFEVQSPPGYEGWTIRGTLECGNTSGGPEVNGFRALGSATWNGEGPSPYPGGYTDVGFGARAHGDMSDLPTHNALYGQFCSPLVADASPAMGADAPLVTTDLAYYATDDASYEETA